MNPYDGVSEQSLAHYTCHRTSTKINIDGNLEKDVWKNAVKSERFVDLVSGEHAFLETRMACLYDDKALYVGFWITEPKVRATLTERDSFIWNDNDVEVFFGGDDCYYEFEINSFGTVYEVFFVYQDAHKKGSRFDVPEFDLRERNVDVLGGFQDASRIGKHPRGKRWAFMDFDFPGLKTAVTVNGKINDPSTIDKGWAVELAFPWEGFRKLLPSRSFPPSKGDTLRAAFMRFDALRYNGKTVAESPGWSLNSHGVYDSHIPESFSILDFD